MKSPLIFLYSLQSFGMKFGLRNIRLLLRSVGDPHRRIKTVHVAGTNGKGSTSSMIAAILTSAGYKVGLYTSPHLICFNERIRINGVMIEDKELARYVNLLKPEIKRCRSTFFEAATAIALKYFDDQQVDIAVIETGLGGRLDSTNVLTPLVSVITTIGMDHTELLGDTIASIAAEKAGIIKRKVPVVIGKINGTARTVIESIAKIKSSHRIDSDSISIAKVIPIQLNGKHQLSNARTAVAAVNVLSKYFVIGNKAIEQGLKQTSELSGLRGRQEMILGKTNILLDAGHNPDGIKSLMRELKKVTNRKIVIIFGVMNDKDYRSIIRQFSTIKPVIVAAQPHGNRALSSSIICELCQQMGIASFRSKNIADALRIGRRIAGVRGLLVITGSHYLLGEAIPLIEKKS